MERVKGIEPSFHFESQIPVAWNHFFIAQKFGVGMGYGTLKTFPRVLATELIPFANTYSSPSSSSPSAQMKDLIRPLGKSFTGSG